MATPDQVETQWHTLTEWQREQVRQARALGRSLQVTVLDLGDTKVLYDLAIWQ